MDLELTSRTVVVSRAVGAVGPLNPLLSDAAVSVLGRSINRSVFAWQSLQNERDRITFHNDLGAETFISAIDPTLFCVRREFTFRTVVLRYLPVELSFEAVLKVLSDYGEIISHTMCVSRGVFNGTREVGMKLRRHLPSHIFVLTHRGVVSYEQQPRTCFICHSVNHLRRECPNRASARLSSSVQKSPVKKPSYASVINEGLLKPSYYEPVLQKSVTAEKAVKLTKVTSPTADTRAAESPVDPNARIPPVALLAETVADKAVKPTNVKSTKVTSPTADTRAVESPVDPNARIPPVAPLAETVAVKAVKPINVKSTKVTSPAADTRAAESPVDPSARLPPTALHIETVAEKAVPPTFVPTNIDFNFVSSTSASFAFLAKPAIVLDFDPSTSITSPQVDARAVLPTSGDRRARNPPPALFTKQKLNNRAPK